MIRRDYLERLIQQVVQALALVMGLRDAGDLDVAMERLDETKDLVLGPYRLMLERLDPLSISQLIGQVDLDRVRLFALLLAEESQLVRSSPKPELADSIARHSLELYGACSLAGCRLQPTDLERIAALHASGPDLQSIHPELQAELLRIGSTDLGEPAST
ncbi:MAG TPA: hypothetical protein VG015_09950 [Candidatus Dormibacteraeota bacterium]|jgi:hypothetical protein|nr:hypothetical protein [Candidatus Dormibacteraeota bacterium]